MKAGARKGRRVTFANATSVVALFVALGGTVYATTTVGPANIRRNAVRSRHIKGGNVKRSDLAANAVNGGKLADGSIAAVDLGSNSVASDEIVNGSVTATKLGVSPQWSNVNYIVGWTDFFGSTNEYTPLQCSKDPFGMVHFRGAAERARPQGGFTIALLPDACRIFPSGTSQTTRAGFTGSTLDFTGKGVGAASMFIGVTDSGLNTLGFDFPSALNTGDGISLDGVAIAIR